MYHGHCGYSLFTVCTMACIKCYCLLFLAACGIYGDVSGNEELRNGIRDEQRLWQTHTMIYAIGGTYDGNQILLIEQSMRNIEQAVNVGGSVCFSFKEKEGKGPHYLYITESDNGLCYTEDEKNRKILYLADNCFNTRVIQSLLVVTMGLYPEHQRPDRDQYIQVHMDNVQYAAKPNFTVIPVGDTDLPYDFHSVTHYGPYQYAINTSLPTITTNVSGVSFGDRDTLSFYDVLKVQTLYGCTKGYRMFGDSVNRFTQTPSERYYPQWRLKSEHLSDYMITSCDTEGNYTLTALNGATWTSKYPLPSGNFCVSVSICIASSSSEIKSYIQLTTLEGPDISKLNYTQPSGHWKTFNMTYTSEQEWTMMVKAHIMWGGDILALNSTVITHGVCGN